MSIPVERLPGGLELPVLGLGAWTMDDTPADVAAIEAALERGVTHVDTAEGYADGGSERAVGKAIRGHDRSRLFLVTKVSPRHLRHDDVLRAAEGSLARLGTDYVDLYLIHHPNPGVPIAETMRALDRLADEGRIRAHGLSNFAPARQREARAAAGHPPVANQVHYNLLYREPEVTGLVDECRTAGMAIVAWRPVEKGVLARRGTPLLDELADAYGRTPAQVALNWLIVQDGVAAIVKTGSREHLEENLGALGWRLEPDDVERLRRDFPGQKPVSHVVPLR